MHHHQSASLLLPAIFFVQSACRPGRYPKVSNARRARLPEQYRFVIVASHWKRSSPDLHSTIPNENHGCAP
jgi:hypothetical protein